MASKRRASPLDEPPTASSSSSSEEETSSEEEESSSEEEEVPPKPPSASQPLADGKKSLAEKPKPAAKLTKPQPKASSSESETESDSGSDSEEDRPAVAADPVVKSTPKSKKTQSQPSETPTRSAAAKRPSENNQAASDSKRAKKKGKEVAGGDETPAAENGGKKAGEESKKLFQRLWSPDDEIAILKGMNDFSAKMGADAFKKIDSFHDFIKKSLHIDVSNDQLVNKIRRMKQKYKKLALKIRKNGGDPRLTKPHDIEAFELSKKIWGSEGENGGTELIKYDEKDEKIQKKGKESKTGPSVKPSVKPETEMNSNEVRSIDSSLIIREMMRFDKDMGPSRLDEDTIRRGFEMIGASERAKLEDSWKELQLAEFDLFVKRTELLHAQASLIVEAIRSSN